MSDLEDDLRKFFGLPPHDEVPNFCRGDGYFMKSVEQKYGASIWVLAKGIPGIWKDIEGWWIVILLRNGRVPWFSGAIENRDDASDVAKEWFKELSLLGGDFTVQIARVEEVFGVAASSG